LAALLLSAPMLGNAQAPAMTGALSGRLTDLYSKPLEGVTLLVRNQATGEEARSITGKGGLYRFASLGAGLYTLQAESAKLGRGHLHDIAIVAGREERMQTAMALAPPIEPSVTASAAVPVALRLPPPLPTIASLALEHPPINAFLPLESLRDWHSNHRISPSLPPQTLSFLPDVWLAAEPLQSFPLPARSLPASIHPLPPLESVLSEVQIAAIPLLSLPPPVRSSPLEAPAFATTEIASSPVPVGQDGQVPAESPATSPASQAVTTTVRGEELQALPGAGRRWQDFLPSTPVAASNLGGESSPHGAGQEPAALTMEGESRDLAFGAAGPGSQGVAGAPRGAIPEAAIHAVQSASGNLPAESGRGAAGRVSIDTERGSNGWHGQGFLFTRQCAWGAQNPFTQWVKETAPATATSAPAFTGVPFSPPDRQTAWGLGMGRHLRRDKLFWFAAFDGFLRSDPGVATVKHPDLFFAPPGNDQMQALSARLGMSNVNPVGEGLAAYSAMLETLDGLLGPAPRSAAQEVGFGRVDWQVAERHRLTLEAIGADWNAPGGGLTRSSEPFGSHSFGSSQASEEWLLSRWEAFLTPNLLAVTQASLGRQLLAGAVETPSPFEQSLLSVNPWGQLPQIVADSRYGFTIGNPARFGPGSYPEEHLYQAQEQVDWVRGGLLMKAGFDFRHAWDQTSLLRNRTGTYSYANAQNFASDALVFAAFGISPTPHPLLQPYCDQTGKIWRDSAGTLHGLGNLPCYSYYSQTIGPSDWWLASNDWAGYLTAQWQARKSLLLSAGLRWEREQMPPPLAGLSNPELPLAGRLPGLGNQWSPRLSLAWGAAEGHWPVLRLGYGIYFGRTENSTLESVLTQTGSPRGDLNFFLRPTDNLNGGGAPPFPAVLTGEPGSVVKPNAIELAPNFRNPQIHQAVAALEERLPGGLELTASALASLGRRLPVVLDTNFDPAVNPGTITYAVVDGSGQGPIKASQISVPFYASWPSTECPSGAARNNAGQCGRLNPGYQQIDTLVSRANSTWEAAMVKVERSSRRGLSLHAHYTYSHAMDWNPSEGGPVEGNSVLDPTRFNLEYGTGDLDVRHAAAGMAIWETPWKLRAWPQRLANGWMLAGIAQYRSGSPYTMRVSGALPEIFDSASGAAIVGVGPGMNGAGGDNRVYGLGSNNVFYNMGRNTYRYPSAWTADLRLGRRFDLGKMRQIELLAESFNLFNHQNVTELETTGYYLQAGSAAGSLPTLNFMTGLDANTVAFGQPLNVNATNYYRPRQIQMGMRIRF
jgi:hypothetical protein